MPSSYLVAVDFSDESDWAIDAALATVPKKSNLTLLHVTSSPFIGGYIFGEPVYAPPALVSGLRSLTTSNAEKRMSGLSDRIKKERDDVKVRSLIREGTASDVISEIAEHDNMALIFTGCRGHGNPTRWIVGSTTKSLARKATCPIVVVKQALEKPLKRLLVPVDYSRYSAASLRLADELVGDGGHLEAMHVWEKTTGSKVIESGKGFENRSVHEETERQSQTDVLEDFMSQLKGLKSEVSSSLESGNIASAIIHRAQEMAADGIVVGAHGASRLTERVVGTVAERLLANTDLPIVLVPQLATTSWLQPGDPVGTGHGTASKLKQLRDFIGAFEQWK